MKRQRSQEGLKQLWENPSSPFYAKGLKRGLEQRGSWKTESYRYRLHRLTLPHAFRTSCSNEIKQPFCTRRRVTYATLCARRRRGERAGETEKRGTKTRNARKDRRRDVRATQEQERTSEKGDRQKHKKSESERETFTYTRIQNAHYVREIVHKAWDKQKCVRAKLFIEIVFLISCDFPSFAHIKSPETSHLKRDCRMKFEWLLDQEIQIVQYVCVRSFLFRFIQAIESLRLRY